MPFYLEVSTLETGEPSMKDVSAVVGSSSLSLFIAVKGIFSPKGQGVNALKGLTSSSSSSSSSSYVQ